MKVDGSRRGRICQHQSNYTTHFGNKEGSRILEGYQDWDCKHTSHKQKKKKKKYQKTHAHGSGRKFSAMMLRKSNIYKIKSNNHHKEMCALKNRLKNIDMKCIHTYSPSLNTDAVNTH